MRYPKKLKFYADMSQPSRGGVHALGRECPEDWGWMRGPQDKRRRVRRLTRKRPGEDAIVVLTDLRDAEKYPATDPLRLYAEHWTIERMFPQVTEVFPLDLLLGGSPQAPVFQFAFCLLWYNTTQGVRAAIADLEAREGETISTEKLFEDVTRELTACTVVCDGEQMVQRMDLPGPAKEVQARLKQWLRGVWSDRWLKDKTHKRRPHSVVPRLGYTCRFIVFSGKPSRNARSPARHDVYSSGDLRPRVKKAKGACV